MAGRCGLPLPSTLGRARWRNVGNPLNRRSAGRQQFRRGRNTLRAQGEDLITVPAEFRLLGEIGVWVDGRAVDIGHTKQTYVLAALAVEAGRCVPTDSLVERVW